MIRKLYIVFYIIILSIISYPCFASNVITDIGYTEQQNQLTINLRVTEKPAYKVFFLDNPQRLVIDLQHTIWQVTDFNNVPGDYVRKIRHGINNGYDHRIVIELGSKFTLSSKSALFSQNKYDLKITLATDAPLKVEAKTPLPVKTKNTHTGVVTQRKVIVIDPGHGGEDPGAISRGKIFEKDISLIYAKALKVAFERSNKYHVFLTRNDDHFLSLNQRVEFARKMNADLFISLHADSHPDAKMQGLSIYTLAEKASDREAERLAKSENEADSAIPGLDLKDESPEVADLLTDLATRDTKNLSKNYANLFIKYISQDMAASRNSHRHAGFKVLKGSYIPSVLIELGYISNPSEAEKLKNHKHQNKIVSIIYKTTDAFFEKIAKK